MIPTTPKQHQQNWGKDIDLDLILPAAAIESTKLWSSQQQQQHQATLPNSSSFVQVSDALNGS